MWETQFLCWPPGLLSCQKSIIRNSHIIDMQSHPTHPNTTIGWKDVCSNHLMHNPQKFYANQHPLDSSSLINNKKHLQWTDLSSGKLKFIRITEHMETLNKVQWAHSFFLQAKISESALSSQECFGYEPNFKSQRLGGTWPDINNMKLHIIGIVEKIKIFISQCFLTGLPFLGCFTQPKSLVTSPST